MHRPHKSSVGRHEDKKYEYLVAFNYKCEENITDYLEYTGYKEVNSIYLAQ
jgi:hypothetical protein